MSVALMPPLEHDPPAAPPREGPLARFWPRAREAPAPVMLGWRDSLTKMCPRSRRPEAVRLRRPYGTRSIGHRPLSPSEREQLRSDLVYLRRSGIPTAHPPPFSNCDEAPGPCPFVGCRQHLYLDVNPRNGSIKLNFPGREPWELEETCAIRVAKRGPHSTEQIARLLNITGERVSQLCEAAQQKAAGGFESLGPDAGSGRVEPS